MVATTKGKVYMLKDKELRVEIIQLYVLIVRRSSHWGGSPQNGLGDKWTCGTTLASAYMLRHLSVAWSQLQMKERESEWE